MVLAPSETGFAGSTVEDECATDYRGATYATAQVTLTETGLTSWDQGWNDDDQQVWGATAGPCVFDRQTALGAW